MARVHPLREITGDDSKPGDWSLWFQWCLYDLEEGAEYGYRFIWKRENGSLQAARGQARLPSLKQSRYLMTKAEQAGWGDRNGDLIQAAANRLEANGCVVNLRTGYVGWPDRKTALSEQLSPNLIEDAQLIQSWCT